MEKYRMILIFDRIFHIKAFYSQIWCFPSLKKKNTAFLRRIFTLFDIKKYIIMTMSSSMTAENQTFCACGYKEQLHLYKNMCEPNQ